MIFHCPIHGLEERDDRFAELESLIAAGWGSTASVRIEAIIRRKGSLPERPKPVLPPLGLSVCTEHIKPDSNAVMIQYDGKSLCISEWARRIGVSRFTLHWRLSNGWPLERALTEPPRPQRLRAVGAAGGQS